MTLREIAEKLNSRSYRTKVVFYSKGHKMNILREKYTVWSKSVEMKFQRPIILLRFRCPAVGSIGLH